MCKVTCVELKSYVYKLEKEMKYERRKIALVIDNAPGHKIFELNDVELIFLPPNMTGVLQRLDAGIIRFFKAHYRIQQFDKNTLFDGGNHF